MSSNRQIVRNLVCNIGVFIVNVSITFFLTPYLIENVGKEAYGFYPLVSNIIGYANIITAAFGSMAGRFITNSLYKGDTKAASLFFNSILLVNWLLSLTFSFLLLITVLYLSNILTIPEGLTFDVKWLFITTGLTMIFTLNSDILGIGTYVKNRIDLNSFSRFVVALIMVTVIIVLFSEFSPSIIYIGVASLCASLVGLGYNVLMKIRLLPELKISPIKDFSKEKVIVLFSSGIWNSITQLSHILLANVDLLITNMFISAAATGDFAVVKMVPNMIFTLLALLASSFVPNFNILYAKGLFHELLHEINKSITIVGSIICIPIGFLLVYSDEFFYLWVPTLDANYLYWLTFATVLPMIIGCSTNPVYGVFTVTNKLKTPSIVLLVSGILNIIFVFVLLKTTNLGIWSILLVSAINQIIRSFFFTPMYASHCLNIPFKSFYPPIFKCCLSLLIVCGLGFVIKKEVLYEVSWLLLIIKGVIITISFALIDFFVILSTSEQKFIVNIIKEKVHA